MSAQQFFLPYSPAFTSNGVPAPGAKVNFYYTGTSTRAPAYTTSSLTTQHANPVVADSAGRFANIYLDSSITYRVVITDSAGAALGTPSETDPYIPGASSAVITIASGVVSVSSRSAMAALTATNSQEVFLSESGREGSFVFSTSDLSASVTADPNQGVYVAPASASTGASGAWVRQVGDSPHNPTWFGVSTANSGAANRTALQAMYDYLAAVGTASSGISNPYRGGGHVRFPAGIFNIVGAVDKKVTIHTQGAGPARYGSATTTKLQWNDTSSGFRVQAINTSGDSTYDAVGHGGGDGSTFSDLWLDGGSTATYVYGTETGDYHGIHFKARIECRGVVCTNWSGDGFHSYAIAGSHGAFEGNANCWRLLFCEAANCRNGLFLKGADTNAGISLGFNGTSSRQAGIYDSSFLANEHHGFHLDANGTSEYSVCTSAGNVYSVVAGQETWCSTNAPSGTTANNTGWRYFAAGGVGQYGARAWVSGQTWRTGAAIISDNGNAYHHISGYTEGGQLPAQYTYPTTALGGQYAGMTEYGTTNAYGGNMAGNGSSSKGLRTALDFQVGRHLRVDGQIDLTADSTLGYAGASQAAIIKDATNGLWILAPSTAATYAFALSAGGSNCITVPAGSVNPTFYGDVNVASGKVYKVNGTQVVSARGAAVADATGAGDVVAQLNALLARCRAHGLIAP